MPPIDTTPPDLSSPGRGSFVRPGRLLVVTAVAIFVSEAVLMLVLGMLPNLPTVVLAGLDAALLTILVFPAIYHLAFKPLTHSLRLLRQEETERKAVIRELEETLDKLRHLEEIIPICSRCLMFRTDEGGWTRLEVYFKKHPGFKFSHGLCPECANKDYAAALSESDRLIGPDAG